MIKVEGSLHTYLTYNKRGYIFERYVRTEASKLLGNQTTRFSNTVEKLMATRAVCFIL